jgi:hypothetical protein
LQTIKISATGIADITGIEKVNILFYLYIHKISCIVFNKITVIASVTISVAHYQLDRKLFPTQVALQ